jgi:hypothetical protein
MRTHYKNGDAVGLADCGCDGCNPSMLNGVLCHERGCPDAWRDLPHACKWCGAEFFPEYSGQACCVESCRCAYYGLDRTES